MSLDIAKIAILTGMVDKLIQLRQLEGTLDEEVVSGLIDLALKIAGVTYREDEIAAVKRDIAYKYQIQAHPGESILAD